MMNKREVKFLNRFIKDTHIPKDDFAEEAGVSLTILNKALKSGNVSDEAKDQIHKAIIRESMQYMLITGKAPDIAKDVVSATLIVICGIITIVVGILYCIFTH